MENLIASSVQFAIAAVAAMEHELTKKQFETLFNVANGLDDERIAAAMPKQAAEEVVSLLRAGIACIDGLDEEHRCDAFEEWARNSLFFDILPD